MLCDICQTREAKIFYTEIVNGKKTEQHLCEQCAAEHAAFPIADISKGNIQIGNILSGLLNKYIDEQEGGKNEETVKRQEPECPECGMSESEFLKYGRFGCPVCYSTFADIINKNFKATQGGLRHCGKEPAHTKIIDVAESVRIRGNNVLMGNDAGSDDTADRMTAEKTAKKTKDSAKKKSEKAVENQLDAEEISELVNQKKGALKEALEIENYEEAARLRDEIRKLEGEPIPKSADTAKSGKTVKNSTDTVKSGKTVKNSTDTVKSSKSVKNSADTVKSSKTVKKSTDTGKSEKPSKKTTVRKTGKKKPEN